MFKKIKLISQVLELSNEIQDILKKDDETIKAFTNWVNAGIKLFPSVGNVVKEIIRTVKN